MVIDFDEVIQWIGIIPILLVGGIIGPIFTFGVSLIKDEEKKAKMELFVESIAKYGAIITPVVLILDIYFSDTSRYDVLYFLMFYIIPFFALSFMGFIQPYNRKKIEKRKNYNERSYPFGSSFTEPDRWFRIGGLYSAIIIATVLVTYYYCWILVTNYPNLSFYIIPPSLVLVLYICLWLYREEKMNIHSVERFVNLNVDNLLDSITEGSSSSSIQATIEKFDPPQRKFAGTDYAILRFPDEITLLVRVNLDESITLRLHPHRPDTKTKIDKITFTIDDIVNELKKELSE